MAQVFYNVETGYQMSCISHYFKLFRHFNSHTPVHAAPVLRVEGRHAGLLALCRIHPPGLQARTHSRGRKERWREGRSCQVWVGDREVGGACAEAAGAGQGRAKLHQAGAHTSSHKVRSGAVRRPGWHTHIEPMQWRWPLGVGCAGPVNRGSLPHAPPPPPPPPPTHVAD